MLGEIAVRSCVRVSAQEYSVSPTGNQYEFYCFDDLLGWRNAPGAHGIYTRNEFGYPISINAFGMRQKEVNLKKKAGVFRIAFLGDSFVWGIGVLDEQRFTDIIGLTPNVESLNFGVSGYGPIQYLILADKIASFNPDLVVVAFCLSNDFGDNVLYQRYGYCKPYGVVDDKGELKVKGYPIRNVRGFGRYGAQYYGILCKYSRLAELIVGMASQKLASRENAGLLSFDDQLIYRFPNVSKEELESVEQAVLINKRILEKIKGKLSAKRIPLVIVTVPTKDEYEKEHMGGAELNTNAVDMLSRTARELDIDVIDAVPILTIQDFFTKDAHWNSSGHQKMAIEIKKYLQRKGYIRFEAKSSPVGVRNSLHRAI